MVNAQEWLDQNYPKETRNQITELDMSNKNLEGTLNLTDFTHLFKLNISFNKLDHFYPTGTNDVVNLYYENNEIVEIDCSYNSFYTDWGIWKTDALKSLNFSNNKVKRSFLIARNLAYLDASNNNLTELDLSQASQGLAELKCSGNHLSKGLNLTIAPNLNSLDCLGFKFDKSNVASVCTNNSTYPLALVSGLSAGFGLVSVLAIGGFFYIRKLKGHW